MKKATYSLIIAAGCLISDYSDGQVLRQQDHPVASLEMEKNSYIVEPGSEFEIQVRLVRTEEGKKTKFGGLRTMSSKEVRMQVKRVDRNSDSFLIRVRVPKDAQQKKHFFVLMGDGENGNRIRGTTFSITVTPDETLTKN